MSPDPSHDAMSPAVNIDAALVRRLLASQFPQWADLAVAPVAFGGIDNRTFHLGRHMAVRLPSALAYRAQVEKEQRWLPILKPMLPVAIPVPLAMGQPGDGYPWHWSVYAWLEGDTAAAGPIGDRRRFVTALADFLVALQRIDATGGPPPGSHNCHRGGPLAFYDAEVRSAVASLKADVRADAVLDAWNASLAAPWRGAPVWLHGDFSPTNLLVRDGALSAIIDFGCCGVGDPACDLAIAWTSFDEEERAAFRAALVPDQGIWVRGRGWALWKALIVMAGLSGNDTGDRDSAKLTLANVLADFAETG